MPAPIPTRDRSVYFVGAGLSCAMGLPNTASLIEGVLQLAKEESHWLQSEKLPERLAASFKFFYPDGDQTGYQPDVVEFFSGLRTYLDVGSGFAGGLADAPTLYRSLKFAIAHLLIKRLRDADPKLQKGHEYLDAVVSRGNIIVTSNWDFLIERYAQLKKVPVRHQGSDPDELVVLKLHGSIDWCLGEEMDPKHTDADYAMLNERLFGPRPYTVSLPSKASRTGAIMRIRALEAWNDSWRRIKSRADDLCMVTMARGKAGDLGPLLEIWRHAYAAVSRAETLEIVGYSMPPDDVEIRTLLRAGIRRGGGPKRIVVRNPSPDVHDRIRRYLQRRIVSNYLPVNTP